MTALVNTKQIIIGITGTNGSGKGTVVQYLVSKYGFLHYSTPYFIRKEVTRRRLPDNRDSMHIVGNALRAEHGPSYIVDQLYEQAVINKAHAVIESIRSVGEVIALKAKQQQAFLLAIDADPKIRYKRILERKSYKDIVSYEKFLADEEREMHDMNPNGMNIAECMKMADKILINSDDVEKLQLAIDAIIETF